MVSLLGLMRAARLGLLLVPLLVSCDTDLTQIVVVTHLDYDPGVELATVVWELSSTTELAPVERTVTSETELPLTLTLVPEGRTDANVVVTAIGLAPDGSELVRQTRATSFVAGVSSSLHMYLSRTCEGVACDEGETCDPLRRARCSAREILADALPPFVQGRPSGGGELCNSRDDDGDGEVDNTFLFQTDPAHCGGCFQACAGGENGTASCNAGECGIQCNTQFGDCNRDSTDGCETVLDSSDNCGECANACEGGTPVCSPLGTCVDGCTAPFVACDRVCRDTSADPEHCGGCEQACDDPGVLGAAVCTDSTCSAVCEPGANLCGSACVRSDDPMNCGPDCLECPAPSPADVGAVAAICRSDSCAFRCNSVRLDCTSAPGCETSATRDSSNCGDCGVSCGSGTCNDGLCDTRVTDFATGPRHACAVLQNDQSYCWGANESGQAGGPRTELALRVATPTGFPTVNGAGITIFATVLALDDETTYFTRASRSMFSSPFIHRLGRDPSSPLSAPVYLDVPTSGSFDLGGFAFGVGGGSFLSVGLLVGPVRTTLLGGGATAFNAFAEYVPEGTGVIPGTTLLEVEGVRASQITRRSLSRGVRETCTNFLTGDLTQLQCWGTGDMANPTYIGDGTTTGSTIPLTVNPEGLEFDREDGVNIGFGAACASFREPGLGPNYYCWGDWDCGPFDATPGLVPGGMSSDVLPLVEVGRSSACAVGLDGALFCWGNDMLGECNPAPTRMFPEFDDIATVDLGVDYGCFTRTNGAMYCWGSNEHGRLGVGDASDDVSGPRQVVFTEP